MAVMQTSTHIDTMQKALFSARWNKPTSENKAENHKWENLVEYYKEILKETEQKQAEEAEEAELIEKVRKLEK